MMERKLLEMADEIKRLGEDLRVSREQLQHLDADAEEARIRSMVSETPLAEQSFHEASRHAEAMRKHHAEVQKKIVDLEERQNDMLDKMFGS
jgi:hypothetical protein